MHWPEGGLDVSGEREQLAVKLSGITLVNKLAYLENSQNYHR